METYKANILCADDDPFIRQTVCQYLKKEFFNVFEAENGAEALDHLEHKKIDLILLDLILPDYEGITLMREIKEKKDIPVIIISSKDEDIDRVIGLETGADDYLTKPFVPRELKARINAILKRANNSSNNNNNNSKQSSIISFGEWDLDTSQYQAFNKNCESANLTTAEFLILHTLVLSPQQTLSRSHLFEISRHINSESYDRAVDIQITRIRKKLGDNAKNPKFIKTIRGIGYMFCGDVSSS